MNGLTDLELELRAAAGDGEAFGELYERYSPRVYDFLHRMVRNDAEAADLMQETFVRAMRSLKLERAGTAELSTWLFTIARNLALTRLERETRTQPIFDDGADDEDATDEGLYYGLDPDLLDNPEAAAQAGEMVELVWQASQALEPKQRTLLDLHIRQGLESAEIADVLGVSKGNAYTMVSRLKDTFESAVASLVMFRAGRRNCPDLNRLLADASGVTPDIRRLIDRHTQDCEICQDTRRQLVSASALLRAFVPLPLMPGIADQIRDGAWEQAMVAGPAGIAGIAVAADVIAEATPASAAASASPTGGAAASSTPVATGPAASSGGFLSSIPAAGWIAAAVAVVAIGAGAAFYTVNASGGGGGDERASVASDGSNANEDATPADSATPAGAVAGTEDDAAPPQVSAGITHTCAVRDGAAWCWGDNMAGALGNGTLTSSSLPVPVNGLTSGVTAIDTGSVFGSCAVKEGGLWCWGALALGGGGSSPRQVPDMASGVSTISIANQTVCAVKDGGAWCWGNNRFGQLGTGTTDSSLQAFSPVVGMDAGVTDISVNSFHTCALKEGAVWCWGQNLLGELGDGTATNSLVPVPVSGVESGVSEIDGNCALKEGAAWCWGDNFENRLFTGATDSCPGGPCSRVALPVQTVDSGVTAVASHLAQSRPCAVKDSAAWCWGSPVTGGTFPPAPVPGLEEGVTAISTGVNHICAVKDGDVYCLGVNADGQLGNGTTTDSQTTPVLVAFGGSPAPAPTAAPRATSAAAAVTSDDPELAALKAAITANTPGIVFDPNCSEQSVVQPCVALPVYAPGVLARGIACFGGGAKVCYGRQADGAWSPWFGTQNSGGPQTTLPGPMVVCADGDGLNLRAEPSTTAAAVGFLPDTTTATGDRYVLTEPGPAGGARFSHGWYHITAPQQGWAYDSFLMDPEGGASCDANWWVGQP